MTEVRIFTAIEDVSVDLHTGAIRAEPFGRVAAAQRDHMVDAGADVGGGSDAKPELTPRGTFSLVTSTPVRRAFRGGPHGLAPKPFNKGSIRFRQ